MADQPKQKAPAEAEETQPDVVAAAELAERERAKEARATARAIGDEEFPVERLQDECYAFLGVPQQTLDGALHLGKVTKKNLTLAEANDLINAFHAYVPQS